MSATDEKSRHSLPASVRLAGEPCPVIQSPRGCPGPQGPKGDPGPQPPLSDAVDSDARDVAASSKAVKTVYVSQRIPCYSPLTLHVQVDGDDANDGLTAATAKKTMLGALEELQRYDARNTVTTLQFGPGAFDIGVFQLNAVMLNGHGRLDIRGAGQDATTLHSPSSTYLLRTYFVNVRVSHLSLLGSLYVSQFSMVHLNNVSLEPAPESTNLSLLTTNRTGMIWTDAITVAGDCAGLLAANRGGLITVDGKVTFTGAPHYENCLAQARDGQIIWDGTHAGSCTGVKYREIGRGTVSGGARHPNEVIPGTVDGV